MENGIKLINKALQKKLNWRFVTVGSHPEGLYVHIAKDSRFLHDFRGLHQDACEKFFELCFKCNLNVRDHLNIDYEYIIKQKDIDLEALACLILIQG